MAKSVRDLADRRFDGTYPNDLREMAEMAHAAWMAYDYADERERQAHQLNLKDRKMFAYGDPDFLPKMRQIAADAYALWRLIETTCGPIVEAWEREQDARDTEEVEAKDAEEMESEGERIGWSDDELVNWPRLK